MHTTEITTDTVLEVLTADGFLSAYDADMLYCDIIRDTPTASYAKQKQKLGEFKTRPYAASECLISAWKVASNMQNFNYHELVEQVIGLVALYVYCTEDMQEYLLDTYHSELSFETLVNTTYSRNSVRSACLQMDTIYNGRQSYTVIRNIRCCIAKLVDYIIHSDSLLPAYKGARLFAIEDIEKRLTELDK